MARARSTTGSSSSKRPASADKSGRGLSGVEVRELDGLFEAIEGAEARVVEIQTALADPELYQRAGEGAATLRNELEQAEAKALALTTRGEELEERKAASGA